MSDRSCGTCTLCCVLPQIVELKKPEGKICDHCTVGKGCKIYDLRPEVCQKFTCLWLAGQIPEDCEPQKVKGFFASPDGERLFLYLSPIVTKLALPLEKVIVTAIKQGIPVTLVQHGSMEKVTGKPLL